MKRTFLLAISFLACLASRAPRLHAIDNLQHQGKKALIIADINLANVGGTEKVIVEIKNRLLKRDLNVEILDFSQVTTFKIPGAAGEPCPYPWRVKSEIAKKIHAFKPDFIFIIPLGIMSYKAIDYCHEHKIPFTVFCSVRMPELIKSLFGFPIRISRYFINSFLAKATNILVPTPSFAQELIAQGLKNVFTWPHGIDTGIFTLPTATEKEIATQACNLQHRERPFYLFVGRITKAKNLKAFLDLDLPGTKILVGEENIGYSLETLKKQYPQAVFPGLKQGQELLNYYQCSDIFVFPSKIDSFGLVLLEALACGLPIVGFNTFGPGDVAPISSGISYLADVNGSLQTQALQAWYDLQNNIVTPDLCHSYAEQFSWETATDNLLEHLTLIDESLLSNAEQARSCYLSSFYKAFGSPIKIIAASAVIGILGWYIGKKPLV